jgi:hypothetical protein
MSASSEARELELVGKVEMKIALAKDDKLESILKPYLPPLLLKLASEHQAVRNKVRYPLHNKHVIADPFPGDLDLSTYKDSPGRESVSFES